MRRTGCAACASCVPWKCPRTKRKFSPTRAGELLPWRATTVAKLDNTGVNGVYLTSEGKKGEAAWGTRGRWCNLSGKIGDEPVTITILDHPANPGFPTYWHARGYGLFAANPLGEKVFSNGKEELNLTLAPHQTVM